MRSLFKKIRSGDRIWITETILERTENYKNFQIIKGELKIIARHYHWGEGGNGFLLMLACHMRRKTVNAISHVIKICSVT